MIGVRRTSVYALVAVGGVAVSGATAGEPPGAGDLNLKLPDYAGAVEGDRDSRIVFDLERDRGERREVTFEAIRVDLLCEDGTTDEIHYMPVSASFARARVFRRRVFSYPYPPTSEHRGSYSIQGRVHSDGTASGYIKDTTRTPDPGESCQSHPEKLRWEAKRVPPADAVYVGDFKPVNGGTGVTMEVNERRNEVRWSAQSVGLTCYHNDVGYEVHRDFFLRRVPLKGRAFSYRRPGLTLHGRVLPGRARGRLSFEKTVMLSEDDALTCRTRREPFRWKVWKLEQPRRDP